MSGIEASLVPPIYGTGALRKLNKDVADHIFSTLPTDAIRLLCLHHGSDPQTIECTMSTTHLSNAKPYDALSYVWGPEADPETLLLCHHEFSITKNLHNALCALRLPDKDRLLWIDALCINQGNDTDKGSQIPLMGGIYKRAEQVIAWLGSPTDDMMPVLCWMEYLATVNGTAPYLMPENSPMNDVDVGLERLYNCDYWNRAWITQEIAFARFLRLQCGHFSIPYRVFRKLLGAKSERLGMALPSKPGTRVMVPTPFRKSWMEPGSGSTNPISVNHFLDLLVTKKCSDARDSVFAFYNLFSRELQKQLPSPSNYRQQPQDVLLKAICAMISSDRSLYAIIVRSRQKVPNGKENAWQLGLPSWCPYVRTPFDIDSLSGLGKFNFGIEAAEQFFENDGKLIRIRGYAIATVSRILLPRYLHRDQVNEGEKYDDEELAHIVLYYTECFKFGLQLPVEQRDSHKTLWGLSAFPGAIMTADTSDIRANPVSDTSRQALVGHNRDQLILEAINNWRFTRSRQVCKFITLDGGVESPYPTDPAGWDADDPNWVDVEDGGNAALVPATCNVGDVIAGIVGCTLPVVLREIPCGSGGETVYQVVGEAYIENVDKYAAKTTPKSFILS